MQLLILDIETTGLDPRLCEPLELAAILWDTLGQAHIFELPCYRPGCEANAEPEAAQPVPDSEKARREKHGIYAAGTSGIKDRNPENNEVRLYWQGWQRLGNR